MSRNTSTDSEGFWGVPGLASRMRQVEDLLGPAGRLEALLNSGSETAPAVAVVCHPYPPAGGTMHTRVVYQTMKALGGMGLPVLRFNFRGVGLSAGVFDHGRGEEQDVLAAVEWASRRSGMPVLLAGFSFGSYVGLRATCGDRRVAGRIALGLPVRAAGRDYSYEFLARCPGPLLFLSGGEDEFCPREVLRAITDPVVAPHRTVIVEGADHFFQGTPHSPEAKLGAMQEAIKEWVAEELLPTLV